MALNGFTDAWQTKLLNYLKEAAQAAAGADAAAFSPTAWEVALFTNVPSFDGTTAPVEVSGGSYARLSIAAASWSVAGGTMSNASTVLWPTATANWGTVLSVGLYNADTAELAAIRELPTPQTINNGETYQQAAGSVTLTLSQET